MADATKQPTVEQQQELDNVIENSGDEVGIIGTKKKYKVRWLHKGTIRKITHIMLDSNERDDDKISYKLAACVILNGKWSIMFFYWFLWRWFYYIKQYNDEQFIDIIDIAKKKVPVNGYYKTIISAIGLRDTIMTMTRKEVEQYRQELILELRTQSEKNTASS